MAAQQRTYNERQAEGLEKRSGAIARAPEPTGTGAVAPLADRMYRGSDTDIADLRKQQAAFKKTERAISRDNAWMAVPALAPVVAVAGLEGAAYIAGRLAPAVAREAPLVLQGADPLSARGRQLGHARRASRARRAQETCCSETRLAERADCTVEGRPSSEA